MTSLIDGLCATGEWFWWFWSKCSLWSSAKALTSTNWLYPVGPDYCNTYLGCIWQLVPLINCFEALGQIWPNLCLNSVSLSNLSNTSGSPLENEIECPAIPHTGHTGTQFWSFKQALNTFLSSQIGCFVLFCFSDLFLCVCLFVCILTVRLAVSHGPLDAV